MKSPYTTKMSSRGQVVIPHEIRQGLNFPEGTPFIVVAREDTIVLCRLKEPPWKFLDEFAKEAATKGRAHDRAMRGFARSLNKLRYGR